ncbi:ribbon-helix-helix domain-containing protein [Metallosphaera hakonensis]|uniref:Ribbon-helix-helix protein, CopG family n=1 Tax=Metallosphaera hakonensis JCM 8857 = DSM 7519 TaxID=1293036 RepID=A0A2U9IW80_9CREN|nr:ribbon-helix-helix domain-containing protein [Metallosphaera hakonensis]AWS00148.1 ribbon-helix-helix protein, CopG family [Metallosphaera hakonensis JCM 8857 = DSM 7519]
MKAVDDSKPIIELDMISKETKTITIKMDENLLQRIDEDMGKRNIQTRSEYMRWVVLYYINAIKNGKGKNGT